MVYRILADVVVVLHFAFILFVVAGGFFVLRWRKLLIVHIPVVIYGALIEFVGWVCPLTPFENWLRVRGGGTGYDTTFTDHYIMRMIYPASLTYELQIFLGILVTALNLMLYSLLVYRIYQARRRT